MCCPGQQRCLTSLLDNTVNGPTTASPPPPPPSRRCLVAFLPHILDSKAAGRNAYLQVQGCVYRGVCTGGCGCGCGCVGGLWLRLRLRAGLPAGACRRACLPAVLQSACLNQSIAHSFIHLQILKGLTAKYKDRPFRWVGGWVRLPA